MSEAWKCPGVGWHSEADPCTCSCHTQATVLHELRQDQHITERRADGTAVSLKSIAVLVQGGIPGVTIDGQPVLNVERITFTGEGVVTAQVSFIPSEVRAEINGSWLVCENCGAGLIVEPRHRHPEEQSDE